MSLPGPALLSGAIAATWPAAAAWRLGPWTIRDGAGGGKRTSAATAEAAVGAGDLPAAETAMRALGMAPLFMIREGEDGLDRLLAARGYAEVDPVNMHAAPVALLTRRTPPPVSTFCIWEPLAIMADIWTAGGIGPDRRAVMHRVKGPRTGLLGRAENQPAAAAFAAIHDGIAMVHALEVRPHLRRHGMGRHVMCQAAHWARARGATSIAAVCTRDNMAANALYTSLGMTVVGTYHYRQDRKGAP